MKNFLFSCLILCLISCSDNQGPTGPFEDSGEKLEEQKVLTDGVSDLGFCLLTEMATEEEDPNLVISPLSIYSALLMVMNGSAEQTLDQIKTTLSLDSYTRQSINDTYSTLISDLTGEDGSALLSSSNAVFWDDNRVNPKSTFLDNLDSYLAQKESLNFDNSDETVDKINDWAALKTNDRIKKVLETIDPEDVMFLMNALYFLGDWDKGFVEDYTRKSTFTLDDGSQVEVDMMFQDEQLVAYTDSDIILLDKQIKDSDFAMSFIQPVDDSSIRDFVRRPNFKEDYARAISNGNSSRMILRLPKFETEGKFGLIDYLKDKGMVDAFDSSKADLSELAEGNLFVNKVLHDTYLKVDEKGVEGAAVTTVGVGVTSLPPEISFDRSFAFILRHKTTGIPIFMGYIENPNL